MNLLQLEEFGSASALMPNWCGPEARRILWQILVEEFKSQIWILFWWQTYEGIWFWWQTPKRIWFQVQNYKFFISLLFSLFLENKSWIFFICLFFGWEDLRRLKIFLGCESLRDLGFVEEIWDLDFQLKRYKCIPFFEIEGQIYFFKEIKGSFCLILFRKPGIFLLRRSWIFSSFFFFEKLEKNKGIYLDQDWNFSWNLGKMDLRSNIDKKE